jgi:hypothetical protein
MPLIEKVDLAHDSRAVDEYVYGGKLLDDLVEETHDVLRVAYIALKCVNAG